VFQQHAADEWADRGTGGEAGNPDANGEGTLPWVEDMLLIRERVEGASVAPAIPSRAREAISISALAANAARIDVIPRRRRR
jgi:hypothetical protein